MRKFFKFSLVLSLLILFNFSNSFSAEKGPKKKVAVLPFDDASLKKWWTWEWSVGEGISDMVITSLVKLGKYSVIEREQIQKIMQEQAFGASGFVDEKSAAKIGGILGVQYVVYGKVTEFNCRKESIKTGNLLGGSLGGLGIDTVKAKVTIDARMIDTTTGEVITVARGEAQEKKQGISFETGDLAGLQIGGEGFEETLLGKATRKAIDDVVKQMAGPQKGKIAVVNPDGSVIINLGAQDGMSKNTMMIVERVIGEVKDPVTGEVLDSQTTIIGEIKIVDVKDRISTGSPDKKAMGKIQVGDDVRTK